MKAQITIRGFSLESATIDGANGSALFDPTRTYRYLLSRGARPERLLFVGLNPSDAGASNDDHTVRRWRGYSRSWGYNGDFTAANVYALVSTDPHALTLHPDPIGPDNDKYLYDAARLAELVVVCWGGGAGFSDRASHVARRMQKMGIELHCIGVTKYGDPVHPLRQRADLKPVPWAPRSGA